MIECIFTVDYEIYGNGEGSLRELVLEPARQLQTVFDKNDAKLVVFAELAELEKIEDNCTDPAIAEVKQQLMGLHAHGHEIGLHLHPQWYRANYKDGRWHLDYSEYNLCSLAESRIREIVRQSIHYLQRVLDDNRYTPLSFRAGNWLLQPTKNAVNVLAEQGIKIDSSVFKGGMRHQHNLDYRATLKNGYFWRISDDVTTHDPDGPLLEMPIYTKMVPFWKMVTEKRVGIGTKSTRSKLSPKEKLYWFLDRARLRNPLKFDFSRMNIDELTTIVEHVVSDDQKTPSLLKPMVAISHTKDIEDFKTVELFLDYLNRKGIRVSTFREVCAKYNLLN